MRHIYLAAALIVPMAANAETLTPEAACGKTIEPGAFYVCASTFLERAPPIPPRAGDACLLEAMWASGHPIVNATFRLSRPVVLSSDVGGSIINSELDFSSLSQTSAPKISLVKGQSAIIIYSHVWRSLDDEKILSAIDKAPPSDCGVPVS